MHLILIAMTWALVVGMVWGQSRRNERDYLAPVHDLWSPNAKFIDLGKDSLTFGDMYAHVNILGATGYGKTIGVISGLEDAAIKNQCSLVSFCYKQDDAERILRKCKRYGIEPIHISPETGHRFDPIAFGVACGMSVSDITKLIMTLARIDKPQIGAGSADFFTDNAEEAFRCGFTILLGSGEKAILGNCREVLNSLPMTPLPDDPKAYSDEQNDWFTHSFMGRSITKAIDRNIAGNMPAGLWRSMEHSVRVLGQEYPGLAPATRSSILQTAYGLMDKALVVPFDEVAWGGKCSWVPDQLWTGKPKWLVVGYEPTRWGVSGELYQIAIKEALKWRIMQRDVKKNPRAVAIFMDEAQRLLTSTDPDFCAVARSQRAMVIFASQGLMILAKRFHEAHPGAVSLAMTGLAQTHIFGQNSCDFTNEFAAKLIGKSHEFIPEMHGDSPSIRQDYRWRVDPSVFAHELPAPSKKFPYAMTVIHRSGKVWEGSGGEPYMMYGWPLAI